MNECNTLTASLRMIISTFPSSLKDVQSFESLEMAPIWWQHEPTLWVHSTDSQTHVKSYKTVYNSK